MTPDLDNYDEEQVRLMEEMCIVIDKDDNRIGADSKKTCKQLFSSSSLSTEFIVDLICNISQAILWRTSTKACFIVPSAFSCLILKIDYFSSNALPKRSLSPICGQIPVVLTPLTLLRNLSRRSN